MDVLISLLKPSPLPSMCHERFREGKSDCSVQHNKTSIAQKQLPYRKTKKTSRIKQINEAQPSKTVKKNGLNHLLPSRQPSHNDTTCGGYNAEGKMSPYTAVDAKEGMVQFKIQCVYVLKQHILLLGLHLKTSPTMLGHTWETCPTLPCCYHIYVNEKSEKFLDHTTKNKSKKHQPPPTRA